MEFCAFSTMRNEFIRKCERRNCARCVGVEAVDCLSLSTVYPTASTAGACVWLLCAATRVRVRWYAVRIRENGTVIGVHVHPNKVMVLIYIYVYIVWCSACVFARTGAPAAPVKSARVRETTGPRHDACACRARARNEGGYGNVSYANIDRDSPHRSRSPSAVWDIS